MRRPKVAELEDPQSMSAMTDVVFLLLIFFIVTMSGYVEMTLLETSLPTSSGAAAAVDLENSVTIELAESGETLLNGTPYSSEALQRLLRRYARLMPEAEFLVSCAPESRYRQLVTLLAELAKHKLKNVKLLKS